MSFISVYNTIDYTPKNGHSRKMKKGLLCHYVKKMENILLKSEFPFLNKIWANQMMALDIFVQLGPRSKQSLSIKVWTKDEH